jgi:hypothetical protein
MEDASAEDLDWFWRGWFYGIEPVDIAIDTVKHAMLDLNAVAETTAPAKNMKTLDKPAIPSFDDISKIRNRADKNIVFLADTDSSLHDFYWKYDRGIIAYDSSIKVEAPSYGGASEPLTAEEKAKYSDVNLYEITFSNKGGLVMPVIVQFNFEDGTSEIERIPAQIWRKNENKVTKVFITHKKVKSIQLDPLKETADINTDNNSWPKFEEPSKFQLFKSGNFNRRNPGSASNPMQKLGSK